MSRIFLSHSALDSDLADAVRRCLEESGVELVQVSDRIRSAEDWSARIQRDLTDSDAALFLVTPNYVERPWFFMEWSAAWIQRTPTHLLLIDVDRTELPDVMLEVQITSFDESTRTLARNLLSVITDFPETSARCLNLAGRLVDLITNERAQWDAAKWSRITASIATGVAALPDRDLNWVVETNRVPDLLARLHEDFAHPALVDKVVRHLMRLRRGRDAAAITTLLAGHTQLSLFRELVETDVDIARSIARATTDREVRRQCAALAAAKGLPDLAEQIADMTEHSYDRRIIAERLLEQGFRDHALTVIERAERSYEKTNFALTCITAEFPEIALDVAATIQLNKELRRIGESLVDHRYTNVLERLVALMVKNDEKRELASYALDRGRVADAETIACTMTVSAELRRVAEHAFDLGHTDLSLRLLLRIDKREHRAGFLSYVLERDPDTAVGLAQEALQSTSERRQFAQILSDADRGLDAISVVASLNDDGERERLFWFALAKDETDLADAVIASFEGGGIRARCEAVRAAAARAYPA